MSPSSNFVLSYMRNVVIADCKTEKCVVGTDFSGIMLISHFVKFGHPTQDME